MATSGETSILNAPKIKDVSPGRYTAGVRPEDIDYLIDLYTQRKEAGQINNAAMVVLTDLNTFKLAKMAGVPGKKPAEGLFTDIVAKKIESMCNGSQTLWHFKFESSSTQADVLMKYKVSNIQAFGGRTRGIGLLNI